MPRGQPWVPMDTFVIDGMPGIAGSVSFAVARNGDEGYWVRAAGPDGAQVERFTSATEVVDLVEHFPGALDTLCELFAGSAEFQWIYLIASQRRDPTQRP